MKTYTEHVNTIHIDGLWIPKTPVNRHYQQFLEEQKRGEAVLVPYTPPTTTWEQIRAQRDRLLKESDWISTPDAQPKPNKEVWLAYRQALRDITIAYSSPESVVWPQIPS